MYRYRQELNQDRLHFPLDSKDRSLKFCLLTGRSRSSRGKQIIRKESLLGFRGSESCEGCWTGLWRGEQKVSSSSRDCIYFLYEVDLSESLLTPGVTCFHAHDTWPIFYRACHQLACDRAFFPLFPAQFIGSLRSLRNSLSFTTLCLSVALNVKSLAVSFLWLLIMMCYLLFRSYVF